MMLASALRPRMAIRIGGEAYKVIAADYHAGGGKMGGVAHARLMNLKTGSLREQRFRADEPVEPIELERRSMQYLYREGEQITFMDPVSFEQTAVDNALLGRAAAFLAEGNVLTVEFLEGQPVGVLFPEVVEIQVAETAPPQHTQGTDNVWKEARLENGVIIQVPPFIAPGERIRVDVDGGVYVARARAEKERRR